MGVVGTIAVQEEGQAAGERGTSSLSAVRSVMGKPSEAICEKIPEAPLSLPLSHAEDLVTVGEHIQNEFLLDSAISHVCTGRNLVVIDAEPGKGKEDDQATGESLLYQQSGTTWTTFLWQ
jgi:hypothetical protein